MAQRERDGERVDLVRRREHAAGLRLRERRVGTIRQVVLLDRAAHGLGVAGQPRVLRADDALQLGKLAYELRGLVGFREPRRLAGIVSACQLLDELAEPLRLVGKRTAAFDERDPLEPSRELLDADRHVAIEGERRVLEPRVEHPRVAGASDLHVAAGRHYRETIPAEREVALVALHGGDDHALGQAQEPLVELRLEDDRPLDHVHDLLELPERVLPVAERGEPVDDAAAALGRVGLDVRRPQRVGVLLGGCDLDLVVSEAVAERLARARQRLAVELLAVPPHRSREAMAARVPAHRLRELEPVDDRAHPLEQRLSAQRLPWHAGPQVAVPLLEVRLGEPVALREAGRRLLAPLRRRPLHELLVGASPAARRRRTRSAAATRRRAMPRRRGASPTSYGKLRLGLAARGRRQLLAADLKQQRRHRASPRRGGPPSA